MLCRYICRNDVNITLMKLPVPFKLTKAQLFRVSSSIISITYGHFPAFFTYSCVSTLYLYHGVCVAETPKYSVLTFILRRFLGPNVRLICAMKCTAQWALVSVFYLHRWRGQILRLGEVRWLIKVSSRVSETVEQIKGLEPLRLYRVEPSVKLQD